LTIDNPACFISPAAYRSRSFAVRRQPARRRHPGWPFQLAPRACPRLASLSTWIWCRCEPVPSASSNSTFLLVQPCPVSKFVDLEKVTGGGRPIDSEILSSSSSRVTLFLCSLNFGRAADGGTAACPCCYLVPSDSRPAERLNLDRLPGNCLTRDSISLHVIVWLAAAQIRLLLRLQPFWTSGTGCRMPHGGRRAPY
uniref:Os02g0159700 protein n=1 Tax=Macrostomum lignano TaxID=282301 RepID=A0A1I8FQ60_9PLAT